MIDTAWRERRSGGEPENVGAAIEQKRPSLSRTGQDFLSAANRFSLSPLVSKH
jgi:hypothetical protein